MHIKSKGSTKMWSNIDPNSFQLIDNITNKFSMLHCFRNSIFFIKKRGKQLQPNPSDNDLIPKPYSRRNRAIDFNFFQVPPALQRVKQRKFSAVYKRVVPIFCAHKLDIEIE